MDNDVLYGSESCAKYGHCREFTRGIHPCCECGLVPDGYYPRLPTYRELQQERDGLRSQVAALAAERDALQVRFDAIAPYAEHAPFCNHWRDGAPCNCGLSELVT